MHPLAVPHADTLSPVGRRRWLCSIACAASAVVLPGLARASRRTVPEQPADAPGFYANFRGMKLLDQDGRRFDPSALAGRTVLVNFVFTGCSTICPVQTQALAHVQRALPPAVRQRFRLVSVSLDPLNDSPDVLKAYARRVGVDLTGWSFVTGRPQDIDRVSDALRLFRPGPDVRKPEDHSTGLWMIDRSGQLRLRYDGNPPDTQRLLREIPVLDQLTTPSPG